MQLRRLPEVLGGARRDHSVAAPPRRRAKRARPGPRTRRRRPGPGRGGAAAAGARARQQAEVEITNWDIVREAAKLMRPSWWLVATALACVVASGVASLALPSYQGKIIDAVYARDRSRFRKMLELYLVFSVGTAATQALRALCFQVVGRRLACALRNELYAAILRAEISYFDSGRSTSRLTQDVRRGVEFLLDGIDVDPVDGHTGQSDDLPAHDASRVARRGHHLAHRRRGHGLLHVVAVVHARLHDCGTDRARDPGSTCSGPADQNRRILAHLGEANAAATEALANVRTVKAMATEDREAKRYADHTMAARDRGIIDACLNALTSILTNWITAGWLFYAVGNQPVS